MKIAHNEVALEHLHTHQMMSCIPTWDMLGQILLISRLAWLKTVKVHQLASSPCFSTPPNPSIHQLWHHVAWQRNATDATRLRPTHLNLGSQSSCFIKYSSLQYTNIAIDGPLIDGLTRKIVIFNSYVKLPESISQSSRIVPSSMKPVTGLFLAKCNQSPWDISQYIRIATHKHKPGNMGKTMP